MLGVRRRKCHWGFVHEVLLAEHSLNFVEGAAGIVESYVLVHGAPALGFVVVHCQDDGAACQAANG